MNSPDLPSQAQAHQRKMQKQKTNIDKSIAAADEEKGVLILLTGDGKGKSSSAFGMVMRSLGYGHKVGIVQFIKGVQLSGEEIFIRERHPEVEFYQMGTGFTWETQDKEQDKRSAEAAWKLACDYLMDESIGLVMLDELNIVLKQELLPLESVLTALQQRPAMQHAIVTGRSAPAELIDIADTVTEMKPIKHAFAAGIRAQRGMEL